MSKEAEEVKSIAADNNFVSRDVSIVEEPFKSFISREFTLSGSWWPDCDQNTDS
jgi:hypothetical protein